MTQQSRRYLNRKTKEGEIFTPGEKEKKEKREDRRPTGVEKPNEEEKIGHLFINQARGILFSADMNRE